MGRRKKESSTDKDVKSFTETKEESLAVFSKESNSIEQEVIDAFEVKPVGKINKLGGRYIMDFTGKNYQQSIELAYRWKQQYEKDNHVEIDFVNYYPQEFMHKSILISYNIKNQKEEV